MSQSSEAYVKNFPSRYPTVISMSYQVNCSQGRRMDQEPALHAPCMIQPWGGHGFANETDQASDPNIFDYIGNPLLVSSHIILEFPKNSLYNRKTLAQHLDSR